MIKHEQEFRIATMCRVLSVSPSAYYQWRSQLCNLSQRRVANAKLLEDIRRIHQASKGTYGSPRITAQLEREGKCVNDKRVAKLMRTNDIRAKMKKRFKRTTRSVAIEKASPNIVAQKFVAERPNQLWTSDVTYIWTRAGWLYLAIVLDVFARRIVGYAMSDRLSATIVTTALTHAITERRVVPDDVVALTFHSDRGSQYASDAVRTLIADHRLVQSMSGTGNCYDNAITETFFHTLKTELTYWEQFETREEARTKIFEYIEVWYNRQRLHSSLGYSTPVEYEQLYSSNH
jgi:transposase InsO family protein